MKTHMVICNEKYDIIGSFNENNFVDYGMKNNFKIGDEVYIYSTSIKAILYKCKIIDTLTKEERIDDSKFYKGEVNNNYNKFARIKYIDNFLTKIDKVKCSELRKHDINIFNFQSILSDEAIKYLKNI